MHFLMHRPAWTLLAALVLGSMGGSSPNQSADGVEAWEGGHGDGHIASSNPSVPPSAAVPTAQVSWLGLMGSGGVAFLVLFITLTPGILLMAHKMREKYQAEQERLAGGRGVQREYTDAGEDSDGA